MDIVLVGTVAGMVSSFVDLAIRGLTVDCLNFSGLVVADLKDFYLDFALAAFFAELIENYAVARKMNFRETLQYLVKALQLSAQEIKEYFSAKRTL